jgi:NADP-dependent 3-hydroxy acid dehydrogenase YdfG
MAIPVAVILGACSRLDEALARRLVAAGWRVGMMSGNAHRLDALGEELGLRIHLRVAGQGDVLSGREALRDFITHLGGIDLLVLGAGPLALNPTRNWQADRQAARSAIEGFLAVAEVAMSHFEARRRGHLVRIAASPDRAIAGATLAHGAAEAFIAAYLAGIRRHCADGGDRIAVTEIADDRSLSPDATAGAVLAATRWRRRRAKASRLWALASHWPRFRLRAP